MPNVTRTERRRRVRHRRGAATRSDVVLRCTSAGLCDFHRDGGPATDRCPGQCDARGCTLNGFYEVSAERHLCAVHAGIVLIARAIKEALAADGDDDAKEGG